MKFGIKFILILLIFLSVDYLRAQGNLNTPGINSTIALRLHESKSNITLADSNFNKPERKKVLGVSVGGGFGLFAGAVLTINTIAEVTDEFHFSTGADIFIQETSGEFSPENPWQFSAVAFYVFRTSTRSQFRIGFGAVLNPRIYPLISLKYDYRIEKYHTIGAEFKNVFNYGLYISPFLLINYTIRFNL
jgi:hypothetical protein